jgi:hypothetical protein
MQEKRKGSNTLKIERKRAVPSLQPGFLQFLQSHLLSVCVPARRRADGKLHDGLLAMRARVAQVLPIPDRWLETLEALVQFSTAPQPFSGHSGFPFYIYKG